MDRSAESDPRPSVELLESVHQFPGSYTIKAIGASEGDFVERVLDAVREELAAASDLDHSTRSTPDGRHVSVTLEVTVQSPDQVREIYARLRDMPGLRILF